MNWLQRRKVSPPRSRINYEFSERSWEWHGNLDRTASLMRSTFPRNQPGRARAHALLFYDLYDVPSAASLLQRRRIHC